MKKKNFKNLRLKKYTISNLAILHKRSGGIIDNDTTLAPTNPNTQASIYPECTIPNGSNISDCITSRLVDCECNTNTGATKAESPSEHQNCPTNNLFYPNL
ncbi:hypothetical protein [uncultured Kordia sp.]|uniref:hypothetical protein n=1 Tax=uncultured Kordia sp. TaxID=507699 RepID=UPI0026379C2F|nr:hypothetical protein [uncultured Kordia sp.]